MSNFFLRRFHQNMLIFFFNTIPTTDHVSIFNYLNLFTNITASPNILLKLVSKINKHTLAERNE